jgi:ABC-2 type transport system ATP-binding protein
MRLNKIISVKDLTKRYGRIVALNNVSFNIPDGITALIGPNGSGKTTLINIMLGLIKADEGKVNVLGFDPWLQGNRVKEVVSVVHEKPRFPSWYTGSEYLEYVAKLYSTYNPKEKIHEASSLTGIAESLNRRIGEYSAGMVQRLALTQVLLNEPKIIILDEPTANLDPKVRIEILKLIKKLRMEKGINFIISSHILSELEKLCSFIVFLYYGRLLSASDVNSLLSSHIVLEYKIDTTDNAFLLKKIEKMGIGELELLDNGAIFKAKDPDGVTRLMQIIVENGMKIKYIEPIEGLFEKIYMSLLDGETVQPSC